MNSFLDNFRIVKSLDAVVTDDTEGTGVGVEVKLSQLAVVIFNIGVSGDTLSGSVKLEPKLQESNDSTDGVDGTWATVDPSNLLASTLSLIDDPAEDDVIQVAEYKGDKGWIRPFVDMTGTHTNGIHISADIVYSEPR